MGFYEQREQHEKLLPDLVTISKPSSGDVEKEDPTALMRECKESSHQHTARNAKKRCKLVSFLKHLYPNSEFCSGAGLAIGALMGPSGAFFAAINGGAHGSLLEILERAAIVGAAFFEASYLAGQVFESGKSKNENHEMENPAVGNLDSGDSQVSGCFYDMGVGDTLSAGI